MRLTGEGGLGKSGMAITTAMRDTFAARVTRLSIAFAHFYPHTPVDQRLGSPALFVPWRAIRPREELRRIAAQRGGRLVVMAAAAYRFTSTDRGVRVQAADAAFSSPRLWLAAGALHTPDIIERSVGRAVRRPHVSDHVSASGHAEGLASPKRERHETGYGASWFEPLQAVHHSPARFAFRTRYGIEQRAVFGCDGDALQIARPSRRLLAEALFNVRLFARRGARVCPGLSAMLQGQRTHGSRCGRPSHRRQRFGACRWPFDRLCPRRGRNLVSVYICIKAESPPRSAGSTRRARQCRWSTPRPRADGPEHHA